MASGGCGRTAGSAVRSANPMRSAETAAERAIEGHAMLILTARDTEALAEAILRRPPGRAASDQRLARYGRTKGNRLLPSAGSTPHVLLRALLPEILVQSLRK